MGVHVPASGSGPHTEGTPAPPHTDPAGHGPQLSDPPQLFPIVPQYFPPVGSQLIGGQVPPSSGTPQT